MRVRLEYKSRQMWVGRFRLEEESSGTSTQSLEKGLYLASSGPDISGARTLRKNIAKLGHICPNG